MWYGVAEGIFEYEENPELHSLFNDKEKEIIGMLRTVYINDEKTSNLEKIKMIAFEGTAPEDYITALVRLRKL